MSISLPLVSIRVLKLRKVKFTTCSTTCTARVQLARELAGILLNIPPTPLGRVTFTEVALKRDRWRKADPRKGYIEIFCLWIFHKQHVRARILNVPKLFFRAIFPSHSFHQIFIPYVIFLSRAKGARCETKNNNFENIIYRSGEKEIIFTKANLLRHFEQCRFDFTISRFNLSEERIPILYIMNF